MEEAVAFTEDLLRACQALGKVRVVMRNPVGVMEVFGDLADLELRDGWAHLCTEPFHLHLHCHTIAEIHFRNPGKNAEETAARSLWFADRSGAPLLLIILDQTSGAGAADQARVFGELHREHGSSRPLMSLDGVPPRVAMS